MLEMEINANDWKSGTEALALCSLCGAEYPVDTQECRDCHVSLSIVRRCPECQKLVSAKHTRCVYCRASFTHELPKPFPGPLAPDGSGSTFDPARRRLRAAVVSVGTFVLVFALGILFLRLLEMPNGLAQAVAQTRAVDSAELRRSPSHTSSIAGMVTPNTALHVTGVQQNAQGRWMVLQWKNGAAYVLASQVAAPRITAADGGVEVLEFFMESMESPAAVEGARGSVDQFAKSFPRRPEGERLRWLLAERMRILAQRGGGQGESLRKQANEQYQQLADGGGSFAEKARAILQPGSGALAAAQAGSRRNSRRGSKTQEVTIVGDSGIQIIGDTAQRHRALVLTEADIVVRAGKVSGAKAGSVVSGRVAQAIEANGSVAVPAGARCRLKVVSPAADGTPANLQLLSIEVDKRSYAVQSTAAAWQPGDAALTFHLDAPLVIQR